MANEEVFEIIVSGRGGNDYCVEARCGTHPPASAEVILLQICSTTLPISGSR